MLKLASALVVAGALASVLGPTNALAAGVDALLANLPGSVRTAWQAIELTHDQEAAIGPLVRDTLSETQHKIAVEVRRNRPDWERRVKRIVNKGAKVLDQEVEPHLRPDQGATYQAFSKALVAALQEQRLVRNR